MPQPTVYVVDDNPEFRASVCWWLDSAGYAVVDFPGPESALAALTERPPEGRACLLLDVRMPGMSGLDLHDRIAARAIDLPVIYMTGHGDVPLAVKAMQKGAVTFIEKPFGDDTLEQALASALAAPQAAAPAATDPVPVDAAAAADPAAAEWQRRHARLTPREREVLDWVIKEKLNKTISDLMGISIKTVELHRSRVMSKLGAKSITQLIKMVVSQRAI